MKTQNACRVSLSLFSAVAVISLSGCSSEEVQGMSDEKRMDEIRFAANTEFSRAGDITTTSLKTFNVYAYTGTGTSPDIFMNVETAYH